MPKNSFYLLPVLFSGVLLFTSCGTLLKGDGGKSQCSCMYFDYTTGTITSECGTLNCGREKITAVRANTYESGNLGFATALMDSVFAVPSYTFKATLTAQALNIVRTKGIQIRVYTQRSDVWYSLETYPAQQASNSRIYLTGHH